MAPTWVKIAVPASRNDQAHHDHAAAAEAVGGPSAEVHADGGSETLRRYEQARDQR